LKEKPRARTSGLAKGVISIRSNEAGNGLLNVKRKEMIRLDKDWGDIPRINPKPEAVEKKDGSKTG